MGNERITRAKATHAAAYEANTECVASRVWPRSATAIGEPRNLPYLKDVLRAGLNRTAKSEDVVIWSNCDVSFTPGSFKAMREHAAKWGAFTMRRLEPGIDRPHMGREVFGFSADWLMRHIDEMPDFLLGCNGFDIYMAAMIRKDRGITTTYENLSEDFHPCEIPRGLATHEPHENEWSTKYWGSAGNVHNRKLFREWAQNNKLPLKFNSNNDLTPH
jgi:hypothetical protein